MVRSVLSWFFSFILGIVFSATFVLYALFSTILSPDFYSNISDKAYDSSIKVLTALLYDNTQSIKKNIGIDDFEKSVRSRVSPSDVKETFDGFVDEISHPSFDDDGKAMIAFDYSNLVDKALSSEFVSSGSSSIEVFELDEQMFLNTSSLKTIFYLLIVLQIFLVIVIAILVFSPWYDVVSAISFPFLSVSIMFGMIFFFVYKYLPSFDHHIINTFNSNSFLSVLEESDSLILLNFIKDLIWMVFKKLFIFLGITFGVSFVLYGVSRLKKIL